MPLDVLAAFSHTWDRGERLIEPKTFRAAILLVFGPGRKKQAAGDGRVRAGSCNCPVIAGRTIDKMISETLLGGNSLGEKYSPGKLFEFRPGNSRGRGAP